MQQVMAVLEQVACSSAECLKLKESIVLNDWIFQRIPEALPILLNSTLLPYMDQPNIPLDLSI